MLSGCSSCAQMLWLCAVVGAPILGQRVCLMGEPALSVVYTAQLLHNELKLAEECQVLLLCQA